MRNDNLTMHTDALDERGIFDPRYTCDLDNSSPELRWENVPNETAGFALIAEDSDTRTSSQSVPRTFTHWLIYNIPASIHHLPAGIPPQDTLPNGIRQGLNSLGKLGYTGPCPALGDLPHRYVFRLFALRQLPLLPSRIQREQFFSTITPYILQTAEIVGTYQRIMQQAG